MLARFVLAVVILLLIAAGGAALMMLKNHRRALKEKDGFLTVNCAGDCGSAFEFVLKLKNGRIISAKAQGGRCAHSLICARAAAGLAQGRLLKDVQQITPKDIAQKAGGLSPEHMHCARLAAQGLAKAVKLSFKKV